MTEYYQNLFWIFKFKKFLQTCIQIDW